MNDEQIQKFILGLAFVIILVKILKRFFKESRPNMTRSSTYGLPSTRAASLFYIGFFLILNNNVSIRTTVVVFTTIIFSCSIKYFMKEHSIKQLTVGSIIGSLIAYFLTKK